MAEVSLLFWNLGRKDLGQRVARLTLARAVDVLVLAENTIPTSDLLALLRAAGAHFSLVADRESNVAIFSRVHGAVQEVRNAPVGKAVYRRLVFSGAPEMLMVAVHLPSLLHWGRDDQTLFAARVAHEIRLVESLIGHTRTVVIGDFNMSPFDPGMTGAGAFHAVMTASLARRESRTVTGVDEPMLYNPMWGLFGDRTPGPPGSFYLRSSKPLNHFWYLLDQVLVRPSLISALTEAHILDNDGEESLLTAAGLPDEANASDHLPLLVRLFF